MHQRMTSDWMTLEMCIQGLEECPWLPVGETWNRIASLNASALPRFMQLAATTMLAGGWAMENFATL